MVALRGGRIRITVDRALRAREKMMKNKANGPVDCLVTEMLQCLPMETVYEVTHWFEKRFNRLVFLKKPDAKLEKRVRGFHAIALLICVLQVVHDGSGGIAARGEGSD